MYFVRIIDATDAYYFADIMGKVVSEKHFLDLKEAKKYADKSFDNFNSDWNSLSQMNDCDGGYDVRIYTIDDKCVYKSHERFLKNPQALFSDYKAKTTIREKSLQKFKIVGLIVLIALAPLLIHLYTLIQGGGISSKGVYYAECSMEGGEVILGQRCVESGQVILQSIDAWLVTELQSLIIFWLVLLVAIGAVYVARFVLK